MIEVNEPTASTLPSNNIMLYFFSAPLKGWVGAVVLRVGSVGESTASRPKNFYQIKKIKREKFFRDGYGVGYLT